LNKKSNRLRNIGIIIAFIMIFGIIMYFGTKGDVGEYLAISQAQELVEYGKYTSEEVGEDDKLIEVPTGYATHIYVVGGNG